jgi:predicted ester cyclase
MSVEENKALTRRLVEEVWNKGNLAVADELLAAGYVFHHPAGQVLHGPEEYKQLANAARSAFPDIHFTIDDIVVEGDKVVYRWTLFGTHKGEFSGIPPTDKKVTV